ncbi:MAG: hypothetical protein GY778_20100 [bacterium]|nr:hypothetical protein [bacterium]
MRRDSTCGIMVCLLALLIVVAACDSQPSSAGGATGNIANGNPGGEGPADGGGGADGESGPAPDSDDESASGGVLPNPHRAAISEEVIEFHDWLEDGSFENGTTELTITALGPLDQAEVERSEAAARTGSSGYAITARPGQGVTFSVRAYVEKGEDIRFSFWVRNPGGTVSLQPRVEWVERNGAAGPPFLADPVTIGSDWTRVVLITDSTRSTDYALLSLDVEPNTVLHIDDMQVGLPQWKIADYSGSSRTVGGITVPTEPSAPVHTSFLTHDADTEMIYIPGWGQALSRHHDRVLTRLGAMLSQFIYHADPDRVNTFYAVTHVGFFYSRRNDPNYIVFDEQTGELIPWLYLKGVSTGGFAEALQALVGSQAAGLSATTITRLMECKQRGLTVDPKLATADGALGFWKALPQVWPTTRAQRCWVQRTANVLDKMAKKVQSGAKEKLHEIWMAPTRADAERAFDHFIALYEPKYPAAVACLKKDRVELLSFYDFPAEHRSTCGPRTRSKERSPRCGCATGERRATVAGRRAWRWCSSCARAQHENGDRCMVQSCYRPSSPACSLSMEKKPSRTPPDCGVINKI